jgi:hypothetical protein
MSKHRHGKGKFRRMQQQQMHQQMNAQPGAGTMQPMGGQMQSTTSNTPVAASQPAAPIAPQMQMSRKSAASGALPLHYEFIPGDLKRIGIVTLAIVVILVVLFIFFR